MWKAILRDRLFYLLLGVVLLRLFSSDSSWVEHYYSNGLYLLISGIYRFLFGWIGFSVGDLLYAAAAVLLIGKVFKFFTLLFRRRLSAHLSRKRIGRYLGLVACIYLVFQLSWGLNYSRRGVAEQMKLDVKPYTARELYTIAGHLKQRLNFWAAAVDTARRKNYLKNPVLFDTATAAYENLKGKYPFLKYPYPSIKSSMFSGIGYYFGFTGYYNPFTGEAQLNNRVPVFLRPFIVSHEIAHQLGYAKENEASFVAYLNCTASPDPEFRYSVYFELYRNALSELRRSSLKDSLGPITADLHSLAISDSKELEIYLDKHRNLVEPLITRIYDRYLRLNNQPKGRATYNEVLLWLIAYLRKNGIEAL